MSHPRVVMVCPRRPDGGQRDRLWAFCRRWWGERFDWPIIEGEHLEGPFNRGKAINDAAATVAGRFDVLLIIDGDVVAEPEQVQAAVDLAHESGRMVLAFTEYCALDDRMTNMVLGGHSGSWAGGVRLRMRSHVSSIIAVPRPLWERTGFDERCEGWGSDDTIFAHTCRVLGGGLERVPGHVWHLNHPVSSERTTRAHGKAASAALAKRYFAAITPVQVEQLIAERAEPDGVAMVVLTDGRRECIDRSIDAALQNLKGLPIVRTVICDDSGDVDYQAWLRWRFPDHELVCGAKRTGFAGNVRRAWHVGLASGQRWVFWLEDDFVVQRPVDLSAIASVLDTHPKLTQMVLRRQPWFENEVAAGGLIEANAAAHTDMRAGEHQWVQHELGHWTNPHLVSRAFLAAHEWPQGVGSEAKFARTLRGRASGYWGPRSDPPLVEHMGERHGIGY